TRASTALRLASWVSASTDDVGKTVRCGETTFTSESAAFCSQPGVSCGVLTGTILRLLRPCKTPPGDQCDSERQLHSMHAPANGGQGSLAKHEAANWNPRDPSSSQHGGVPDVDEIGVFQTWIAVGQEKHQKRRGELRKTSDLRTISS